MEAKAMSDQKENEFAALVGWDWADQSHEIRLVTASGEIERSTIAQSPNGLHDSGPEAAGTL